MLTPYERETVIIFNEAEATARVYTHNKRLIHKLEKLSEKYPSEFYPERKEHDGAVSYIVPKHCIYSQR